MNGANGLGHYALEYATMDTGGLPLDSSDDAAAMYDELVRYNPSILALGSGSQDLVFDESDLTFPRVVESEDDTAVVFTTSSATASDLARPRGQNVTRGGLDPGT